MYETFKFKRARNCLKFLVKTLKIKELYIPYYLCDVIRHSLAEANCHPLFYHIDDNFLPIEDLPRESYILYPNYFGICKSNIRNLCTKYPKLIVDNAHAFYDEPNGYAGFNSGAKFGLGENAYLWIKSEAIADIECDNSNKISFEYFSKNEAIRTRFIELYKKYKDINQLKINPIESFDFNIYPFCYPLLLSTEEEADRTVKELENDGLTIYRYWNRLPKSFNEYKFYSRLVPIPIAELQKNSQLLNAQ